MLRDTSIAGAGVDRAVELSNIAFPGQIIVTRTLTDLVAGSGFNFTTDDGELFTLNLGED